MLKARDIMTKDVIVVHPDTEISQASGYKLLGARVLYYGLCPDCQTAVQAPLAPPGHSGSQP